MLLHHVIASGGLGDALQASRAFVEQLAEEFSSYVLEGDELATPAEFTRRMMLGLDRIKPLTDQTRAAWESRMTEPAAQIPFTKKMAISPQEALPL